MFQIKISEIAQRLNDLMVAARSGETIFVITDDEQARFELVPIAQSEKSYRKFGTGKGLFKMADDFDSPLEDFKEYSE